MGFDSGEGFTGLGGGGGGGGVALTYTQIAFGSPSNTVTSSSDLTYDETAGFSVGFSGVKAITANTTSSILYTFGAEDAAAVIETRNVAGNLQSVISATDTLGNTSTGVLNSNTFSLGFPINGNLFKMDDTNNFIKLGDVNDTTAGQQLVIENATHYSGLGDVNATHNGNQIFINDSSNVCQFGDVNFTTLGQVLIIDNANAKSQFGDTNNAVAGMLCVVDNGNSYAAIGDVNANYNGMIVMANDVSGNEYCAIGDITLRTNHTYLKVYDYVSAVISTNAWATPTMTNYTNGSSVPNVTIANGVRGLYYNPASPVSAATITLPSAPVDGQEVIIIFGGTITSGTVVNTLTISPNTGQTALIYSGIASSGIVGLELVCRYFASTSQWFVMSASSSSVASVSNSDGTLSISHTSGSVVASIALGHQNKWTAGQAGAPYALTDATTIAVSFANGNNFTDVLTGNRTLGVPTNVNAGQSGIFAFTQDGTGSRTLAYSWCYLFSGGTAPTLSTVKYITDVLPYIFLYNSSSSAITASGTTFTWAAHGMTSGQIMQFTAGTTTTPALNTSYWVNVLSSSTFNLATSLANLQAGTYITASGVSGNLIGLSLGVLISSLLNIQQ